MPRVLEETKPVSVISVNYLSSRKFAPNRVRNDGVDTYRILCAMSEGRHLFELNGRLLLDGKVSPGMIRVSQPGLREHMIVKKPFDAVAIAIPGSRIRRMVERYDIRTSSGHFGFEKPLFPRNRCVMSLVRELHPGKYLTGNAGQSFIDGISEALLALLLGSQGETSRYREGRGALNDKEFGKLVDYAEGSLNQKIHLSDWADVVRLPITDFSRKFQEKTGDTPYCWLMNRRIERAKRLLKQKEMPLCEISFAVGFGSQSHFTEAFRRRVGMPPARWRCMHSDNSKSFQNELAADAIYLRE